MFKLVNLLFCFLILKQTFAVCIEFRICNLYDTCNNYFVVNGTLTSGHWYSPKNKTHFASKLNSSEFFVYPKQCKSIGVASSWLPFYGAEGVLTIYAGKMKKKMFTVNFGNFLMPFRSYVDTVPMVHKYERSVVVPQFHAAVLHAHSNQYLLTYDTFPSWKHKFYITRTTHVKDVPQAMSNVTQAMSNVTQTCYQEKF